MLKKIIFSIRNKKRDGFNAVSFDKKVQETIERLQVAKNVIHLDITNQAVTPVSTKEKLPHVVLVPGAFFREYPQHGGYGQALEDALLRLGVPVTRIDVPSFSSVDTSGQLIFDWFSKHQGEPVIIVSLSKGSTDVIKFFSLLKENKIPVSRFCHSWISVCGIIFGTPIVEAIKKERIRFFAIQMLFRYLGYKSKDLNSLNRVECEKRAKEMFPLLSVPSYHVVAVPYFKNLSSKFAIRAAKRAWEFGASDGGGVLIEDYLSYPGTVVALHRADHYFKNTSIETVLSLILSQIKDSNSKIESSAKH